MKRFLSIITAVLVAAALCGCTASQEDSRIREPVSFYYLTQPVSYNTPDGVIAQETREAYGYGKDLTYLIGIYLKGPLNYQFTSPFPSGVTLVQLSESDGHFQIVLSNEITQLTGYRATLACACITMTLHALAQAKSVTVSAADGLINDSSSITMTPDDLVFPDLNTDVTEAPN